MNTLIISGDLPAEDLINCFFIRVYMSLMPELITAE